MGGWTRTWPWLLALCGAAVACRPPAHGDGDGGSDGDDMTSGGPDDGDDAPGDDGDDDTADGPGPVVLAAPDAVARGGRIYVMTEALPRDLVITIDDQPLGAPEFVLRTDVPGGIYRVPDAVAVGEATLGVRYAIADATTRLPLRIEDRRFVDVASQVGLDLVHDPTDSPEDCAESHTGLAFGDVDNDGDPDFFFGNLARGAQLMENLAEAGTDPDGLPLFDDRTAAHGLEGIDQVAMATFVDLEGDGDLDLYVGRRGHNRVFENRLVPDGAVAFVDVTDALGLGTHSQRTMGVAFGDYDGDGDLDLYVVNHAYCFPVGGAEVRAGDHLYENVDGTFVERTAMITGAATESVGFSASWVDWDRDGDQDLIIINDAVGGPTGQPNALWRNDGPDAASGGWRFTDVSESSGAALPGVNGMGLAVGDIDHDGALDFAFSNIGRNYLVLGDGVGHFSAVDSVDRGRLPWDRESTTWATHLLDHDNDGDLDLYFTGGRIKGGSAVPDALLDNDGAANFADRTWVSGMADPGHGKGSVLVDLDQDGAWDIVTAAWGAPLAVYHNRAVPDGHHWLAVDLVGPGGNRDAIGAIVELADGDRTQTCFHTNRPSLGGGGELTCHFGLGTAASAGPLSIHWPDGVSETIPIDAVDQRLRRVHPSLR